MSKLRKHLAKLEIWRTKQGRYELNFASFDRVLKEIEETTLKLESIMDQKRDTKDLLKEQFLLIQDYIDILKAEKKEKRD